MGESISFKINHVKLKLNGLAYDKPESAAVLHYYLH